ncbi:RhoGAP-domain-containing protein [Lactarius deliciosus]|nr:RhoGAP-domain-containing protein [Lactarius deliciosus]
MVGDIQGQPLQDDNDDLSSLYSRSSIQNSPDWPSVRLPSPGPSFRTLNNESDDGKYSLDDISSLANFSCEDMESDRGSVFTVNISTSPSNSRPSTPSSSSYDRYEPPSSENLGAWRQSEGFRQSSPSRADKGSDQSGMPRLSSRKSTIGSTSESKQDSPSHGVSLLVDDFKKDLPLRSEFTNIIQISSRPSIPNGDDEGRREYLAEGRGNGPNITVTLCRACGLPLEGQFVRALKSIFHLQCFTCIDCGDVVASKFFPIGDPNEEQQQLCERDYFRRLNLCCAKCDGALRGSYITATNKKYHIEHFTCALCPTLFGPQDSYYEHDNEIYCHYHYSTRFSTKCAGCSTAILKQFVEINRNQRDECWHPECYMINKFWNVKVAPHWPGSLTSTTEPPYVEEERLESTASLKEKQIKMEEQVYRIWTVLSAYEESSAASISDTLRHVSSGQYLEAIRMAERTVLNVEVLFATIDDLEWHFARLGMGGMTHVRESRMLCRKMVELFVLLSHTQETGARRAGMAQELLALVTGIAHYLKILIRIALTGALKLGRDYSIGEALQYFLDKLHQFAVEGGSPSARRMTTGIKDDVSLTQRSTSINSSTYGVTYGFRSLAPEIAGESPFFDTPRDFAPSKVLVPSTPSDACVACALVVEEDCVRLGAYQRWHSNCVRCDSCGIAATPAATANSEDQALIKSGRGVGDGSAAPVISTARRPPANVDFFFWSPDNIRNNRQAPVIYCTDHAYPGCRGGFQAVTRLEQYAFVLNVALRRLHLLLKKQNVIIPMPTNSTSLPSGETDSSGSPRDLMRVKGIRLDRKLSETARIPKRSTIVESPSDKVALSSDASVSKGNPSKNLPPEPAPANIPRLEETEKAVQQRRALPSVPTLERPTLPVWPRPRTPLSPDRLAKLAPGISTPVPFSQTTGYPTTSSIPLSKSSSEPWRIPTPAVVSDVPQPAEAAQTTERRRSVPPQNLAPYVAELTSLELAIVRHAAVAVLYRSSLRDEMDLDQVLEMFEVKRQRFWERLFKPGDDRKKKGLFGVPLELLVERDGVESLLGASRAALRVPCFVNDAISAMRQMDMAVDFRKTGSIRRRKELVATLDRDLSSVDFSRERPQEIASLLKQFLCEIPDPLLTLKLQGLFIAAAGLPDDEERKRLLHMLTLILPKCHRDTLEVLLVFLKWLSSFGNAQDNVGTQLYLSHVASEIGPSVLFAGNWVDSDSKRHPISTGGGGSKKDSGTRVLTKLLENQDQFFTVPEEFLPLLHDQEFFTSSMELSSRDFLKQCETYMRIKFGGPAADSVRIRGTLAEKVR